MNLHLGDATESSNLFRSVDGGPATGLLRHPEDLARVVQAMQMTSRDTSTHEASRLRKLEKATRSMLGASI